MGPTKCTPVALGFKGQKGDQRFSVANKGDSGRQSLGNRPWNRRPCGRQRALSAGRPGRHVRGLLGVSPLFEL